jgi:group I intron endonuclease
MAKSIKGGEQCVYLLNRIVGEPKAYVGSTVNKYKRFKAYQSGLTTTYVERAITKNGWDVFQRIEIDVKASTEKELRAWEGFYIKLFGTYKNDNPDFGMNIVKNPKLAISKDPVVAKKISESKKGKSYWSEESKLKLSNSTKGKVNVGIKRPYLSERNKIVKPALGRTGEKHPMSKKVLHIPDNQVFNSIKEAGDYFGISRSSMRHRIETQPSIYRHL